MYFNEIIDAHIDASFATLSTWLKILMLDSRWALAFGLVLYFSGVFCDSLAATMAQRPAIVTPIYPIPMEKPKTE
jgi:hypothetical protein